MPASTDLRQANPFAVDIGLSLPFFTFFLVYALSIATGDIDQGKTVYIVLLFGYLLTLSVAHIAWLYFDTGYRLSDTLRRYFFSNYLQTVAAAALFMAICALVPDSGKELVYLALILAMMSFSRHLIVDQDFLSKFCVLLAIAASVHLFFYAASGFASGFISFFAQKNLFALNALMMFFGAYIVFRGSTVRDSQILAAVTMFICAFLIFISHSRAALADIALFFFLLWAGKRLYDRRWRYWLIFILLICAIVAIVPAYVLLSFTNVGQSLDAWFASNTGVHLFSGRNIIWPIYLFFIARRPWLGYGFGNVVGNLMVEIGVRSDYVGLSGHNLYLMVASETGVVGLIALLIFFATIWHNLYRNRRTTLGAIACAVFLTCLANDAFEVSLVQTNFDVIAFFWFIIGLGLGKAEIVDSREDESDESLPAAQAV